jgi:hypothetical protein
VALRKRTVLRHAVLPADPTWLYHAKKPVNVLSEGSRRAMESSILSSFETDCTGRVKAGPQIETGQRRSAAAFTPTVILFLALPEAEDNADPG